MAWAGLARSTSLIVLSGRAVHRLDLAPGDCQVPQTKTTRHEVRPQLALLTTTTMTTAAMRIIVMTMAVMMMATKTTTTTTKRMAETMQFSLVWT